MRLIADIDMNDLVEHSRTVLRLLRLAEANRLALGKVDDGLQVFQLPGPGRWEQVEVQLDLPGPLSLADFGG
jgi:IS4 transposase